MTITDEATLLLERGTEPWFDGSAIECPACAGLLDQRALVLDLEGVDPLSCGGCGAVLAA